MSEAPLRNLARHCLDQIARFAGDHVLHYGGDLRVVDGVGEIVAVDVEVKLQNHVDDERLALATLLGEDAVEAVGGEAAERDPVDGEFPLTLS